MSRTYRYQRVGFAARRVVDVTDCLGRVRTSSRVYADGSYTCPFCAAAVLAEAKPQARRDGFEAWCFNPVCPAGGASVAQAQEAVRVAQERAERARQEAERSEAHRRYAAGYQIRRAAELEEARQAGYCLRCFSRSGGRTKVRHRAGHEHLVGAA